MDKNTTMRQLFERFDEACNDLDRLKFIIESMTRATELESVRYTADDNGIVLGETYTIQSVGLYTIKGFGSGKFSYVIKNPNNLEEIYSGHFSNNAEETKELYLTCGDICYFHASADAGKTQTIMLKQKKSLFGLMSGKLNDIVRELASSESRLDNALEYIQEINGALVFESVQEMETYLRNSENMDTVIVGNSCYIKEYNTPDYWISRKLDAPDPVTGYYCEISPLESKGVTIFLTQAEYDALPDTKFSDGVTYRITDSYGFYADTIAYDNTQSGLDSLDVQGAVDEIAGILNRTPVNNNILINSKFISPINQRSLWTYESTDDEYKYTIDRWRVKGYCSVAINSESVSFTAEEGAQFNQPIEFSHQYYGKTVTLSVKVKSISDGAQFEIGLSDGVVGNTRTISSVGITTVSFVPVNSEDAVEIQAYVSCLTNGTIELEWAKLEEGSVATPYAQRIPSEEMLLCRRFYKREHLDTLVATGYNSAENSVIFSHPLGKMRGTPVVRLIGAQYSETDTSNVEKFAVIPNGNRATAWNISAGTTYTIGINNRENAVIEARVPTAKFTVNGINNVMRFGRDACIECDSEI